jgi:8-oxo-dGTP pyrophosphatase MutT (NUDIX family)
MRELAEETGLEADLEPSGVETDMTEYGGILLVVMRAVSFSGTPVPGDDAAGLGWFDPSDPPPLAFAAHARILGRMSGRR